jgi:hypothetical protein
MRSVVVAMFLCCGTTNPRVISRLHQWTEDRLEVARAVGPGERFPAMDKQLRGLVRARRLPRGGKGLRGSGRICTSTRRTPIGCGSLTGRGRHPSKCSAAVGWAQSSLHYAAPHGTSHEVAAFPCDGESGSGPGAGRPRVRNLHDAVPGLDRPVVAGRGRRRSSCCTMASGFDVHLISGRP